MAESVVINEDSILQTTKKLLGLSPEYSLFDLDVTTHINSVFSDLCQMGVGPQDGFFINGENEKWSDFLDDKLKMQQVKSYMFLKVRLLFDPPTNSVQIGSIERSIKEMETRLYTESGGH